MVNTLKNAVYYSVDRVSIDQLNLNSYISTDNLLQNKLGRIDADKLPSSKGKVTGFIERDILVANIRPYLKKIWYADMSGGSSADVLTFRVKDTYTPKFVYYALFRDEFFEHMMNGSKGTKMPRGDKTQILNFPIPFFEKNEQKKIADVLSVLDKKIALNNKINTELEAMAKLIYDYWFVQFDFPDANGKPYKSSGGKMVYNEELKREIPAGWKLEAVGEHLNIYDSNRIPMSRKERDAKQGPYPYFGATGVMDHVNDYIFDDDYILVAEDGSIMDESGMPIVQFIWGKTWVNNHAHVMQAKKKSQNEFYFQSLKRIPVVLIKTGSIQLKINQANLMAYKLLVPNDELVNKYSFLSGSVREKLKSNSEETKKLIELRDWLLPMLMNGQVTVKGTHHCTKGKLKRGSTIL